MANRRRRALAAVGSEGEYHNIGGDESPCASGDGVDADADDEECEVGHDDDEDDDYDHVCDEVDGEESTAHTDLAIPALCQGVCTSSSPGLGGSSPAISRDYEDSDHHESPEWDDLDVTYGSERPHRDMLLRFENAGVAHCVSPRNVVSPGEYSDADFSRGSDSTLEDDLTSVCSDDAASSYVHLQPSREETNPFLMVQFTWPSLKQCASLHVNMCEQIG